jgi:site-specific DNA recombinase
VIIRKIESKTSLRKKRVAAYARVSTEAEEQQESLRTQVNYYETFIRQNPMWEYVQVYADPGRSGTGAANRPEFQKMIADAKAGKLDIILVKSISRFARNVVDAQKYVHELKAHEVEVRFEREAISSFDPASDMIFSVLAAAAQEESRSISENVKWSYRKHAEKGIRRIGNNRVLGYDTDKSGKLVPNGDAWIVRQIFTDYANDLPLGLIVQRINEAGAKRLRSDKPFTTDAILRLLDNELYVGDRMIQKEAPHNYLTKRPDPTVSYSHYYVTDDHEGIISRETWTRACERRAKRREENQRGVHPKASAHFLYGIVYCAECGAPYKRRTMKGHNGESYKTWNCAERQKGNGCGGPMIREAVLLKAISDSLGWLWTDEKHFNADLFLDVVRRIEVSKDGVKVEL